MWSVGFVGRFGQSVRSVGLVSRVDGGRREWMGSRVYRVDRFRVKVSSVASFKVEFCGGGFQGEGHQGARVPG